MDLAGDEPVHASDCTDLYQRYNTPVLSDGTDGDVSPQRLNNCRDLHDCRMTTPRNAIRTVTTVILVVTACAMPFV